MPFDFDTSRVRYSNTEKRTSKFDPLNGLNLMKNVQANDVDMDMEEEKSEERKEQFNRPSLGSITSLFKSNIKESKNISDAFPPLDENSSLQGLRLERTSNIS